MLEWSYLSQAWSLCEIGKIASDALSILSEIKVVDTIRKLDSDSINKLKRIDTILDALKKEIEAIGDVADEFNIPLADVSSPILQKFLDLHGVANIRDAVDKIEMLSEALDKLLADEYEFADIEQLEDFLKAILKTSTDEVEKLMSSSDSVWVT